MVPADYSKDLRRLTAGGKTLDEALAVLRARGISKVISVIAVRNFLRSDLAEAKRIVHFSSTWADLREEHERFHADLERALDEYQDSGT